MKVKTSDEAMPSINFLYSSLRDKCRSSYFDIVSIVPHGPFRSFPLSQRGFGVLALKSGEKKWG